MTKVMVVDDEPAVRELIAAVLQDVGYVVVSARNGQEALELLPAERPEVVVLDIMMPGLDGREVYRRLRAVPGFQDTRVVLISAALRPNLDDDKGAAFLPKPFDIDELLATIQRILRA